MTVTPAARVLAVAGWLGGMVLILAGQPLPVAAAVLWGFTAAAVTSRWWVPPLRGLRLAVRLRLKVRKAAKTGSAVERA